MAETANRQKTMMANYLRDRVAASTTTYQGHQDLFARIARAAGVAHTTVEQIMAGVFIPLSDEQLRAMAGAVGADPAMLIFNYEEDQRFTRGDPTAMVGATLMSELFVMKDAQDKWRWTIVSSTAYKDQDGEIVSAAALAEDVERADKDHDYGPLLWWHAPKCVLGRCDYNAIGGPNDRYLIESGVIDTGDPQVDDLVAEALGEKAKTLGVSIGFDFPVDQRTKEGVFMKIRRKERSLLPSPKASNLFTSLVTIQKEAGMNTQAKYQAFLDLFKSPDVGQQVAMSLGKNIAANEATAQAVGAQAKEASAVVDNPANPQQEQNPAPTEHHRLVDEVAAVVEQRMQQGISAFGEKLDALVTTLSAGKAVQDNGLAAQVADLGKQLATLAGNFAAMQKAFDDGRPAAGAIDASRATQAAGNVVTPQTVVPYVGHELKEMHIDPTIYALFGV